ncbi:MAG: hydrogenase maturation protease [Mycobacteriales bacterium]
MTRSVLVAGVGNVFFQDDGFGPAVAAALGSANSLADGVRVVDYGIRGMHLAYDLLSGVDALVLVDAVPPGPGTAPDAVPGTVAVLEIGPDDLGDGEFDAHGMAPAAMLASLGSLGGELPPTYLVGCVPEKVGEGIGLSAAVAAAVESAVGTTAELANRLAADHPGSTRPAPLHHDAEV